jgi:hypothetical protein
MRNRFRGAAVVIMVGRWKGRLFGGHYRQFVAFRAPIPKPAGGVMPAMC